MNHFLGRTIFRLVPAMLAALVLGVPPLAAAGLDYAIGGGQGSFFGCLTTFSLSAHSAADAPATGAGGTYDVKLSGTPATCSFPESHFISTVDCVEVGDDDTGSGMLSGSAQATALVTSSDGIFATLLPAGSHVRVDVFDSGVPGGMGDMIGATSSMGACDFSTGGPYCRGATQCSDITNGNIDVHDD